MSDEGRKLANRGTCVAAAEQLLTYVDQDLVPALRRLQPAPKANLVLAFFMRGLTTFEAMVVLASHGYGEQVAMLNRSLFEQMLDSHWTADNWAEARTLMKEHEQLTIGEFAAASQRHPGYMPAPASGRKVPTQQVLAKLKSKFARAGFSWTARGLRRRVGEVRDQWPPNARPAFDFFADVPHTIDNLWLHPSPFALKQSVAPSGTGISFNYGPSGFYVEQALFFGCWNLGQLIGLVIDMCKPPGITAEAFQTKAFGPACAKFIVLSAEEMKAGRNDPCPCESGLKFKRCHGA